jgi:negative regulator of sigma E activity
LKDFQVYVMNEDKEKISAWLDDAIEYNEMVTLETEQDDRALTTATRYQMIGDAIRGKVTEASMIDVSASVREAIRREPEFAPVARPASHSRRPVQRDRKPLFDLGSWLRPVGGLAVAATVAMVMVVTLTDKQTITDSAVVANVGQQPVRALPVNNSAPVYTRPGIARPAVNLNSYVTEHSEYAAQDTIQGMMPYARSVSYGSEKYHAPRNSAKDRQTEKIPGK